MSVDRLRDSANTRRQQRGGLKGEGYSYGGRRVHIRKGEMNKKFWSILLVIMLSVVAVVMIVSKTDHIASEDPSSAVKIFEPPASIEQLTEDRRIANYLKQHHRLPHFYITKKQARELGWDARKGNLCQILPGKAIGGDLFSNRERQLPEARGRIWHEADVNYKCGLE